MKPQVFSYTMAALLVFGYCGLAGAAGSSEALDQLLGTPAVKAALESSGTDIAVVPDVPAPDMVDDDFGINKSEISSELPTDVRAFLDVIAYAELRGCAQFRRGSTKGYNIGLNCRPINSYSEHPNIVWKAGRWRSTAAGRYQFLYKTWKRLGMNDFSPDSQDRGAVKLIQRAGAYKSVANASSYRSFARAVAKLSGIWASFPGSRVGQQSKGAVTMRKLRKVFLEAKTKYSREIDSNI